jgi:hypothetical protein
MFTFRKRKSAALLRNQISVPHYGNMFENRVLRKIFGQQRDKMVGVKIKLPNENFTNVPFARYDQNYKVKEDEMCRACSMNG